MIEIKSLLSFVASAAAWQPKLPESPDFWMPRDSSVTSRSVDWIYMFMMWMSAVSCVIVFGAMTYFAIRYRARSRAANEKVEKSPDHSTVLEITWSALPLFVLVALFVWGFKGYLDLRASPADSMEIRATGQKWKWVFTYPGGMVDDTLHVPLGKPVRIVISSSDVLHSLFIPNFRVKMDAVPGRYTDLWFQATEAGEFPIFCTEYCGTDHSDMLSKVVVHPPGGYEQWLLAEQDKLLSMPPAELGKVLYEKQGCAVCHSVDGTPKTGPSWKGLFGRTAIVNGGTSVRADENYIRESIVDPTAKVVQGFAPSMPTYQGKLKDVEIDGIIAYIKTLK
ncbi:MAG TPA: cytochrome c oxidase subunit II [Polyangiaceae bacterium]|nr:cytochrome c oxidase subunit II [Polyangiaceae bacterium]